MIKEFIFCVGLPGCGKSTFLESNYKFVKAPFVQDGNYFGRFVYTDNKYKEASGTVAINYDTSIGINFLRVAEYDSDKKFIKSYRVETANASSITLDTNTRFVRITFRISSSSEKRFPLLFSTYTVTNV